MSREGKQELRDGDHEQDEEQLEDNAEEGSEAQEEFKEKDVRELVCNTHYKGSI